MLKETVRIGAIACPRWMRPTVEILTARPIAADAPSARCGASADKGCRKGAFRILLTLCQDLPAKLPVARSGCNAHSAESDPPLDKTRILHVDDDPDIRDLTRLSFELDRDFTVESVSSGADALHRIARSKPDLILLDVMMPEMDGRQLMRILQGKPETAGIPVVFMTALSDRETLSELGALGALGIISKPFDAIALADDIKDLLHDELDRVP